MTEPVGRALGDAEPISDAEFDAFVAATGHPEAATGASPGPLDELVTPERLAELRRVCEGVTPGPPDTELIYDVLPPLLDTIDALRDSEKGLVAALRSQITETNRLTEQNTALGVRVQQGWARAEKLETELAEARAAAPEPLWRGPAGQLAASLLGKRPSARGWDPNGEVAVYRADDVVRTRHGDLTPERLYEVMADALSQSGGSHVLGSDVARARNRVWALLQGEGQ